MKNVIALSVLTAIASTTFAEDNEFQKFALKRAHSIGFKVCDEIIREIHKNSSGDDMHVNVTYFYDTQKTKIKMTSVWGSKTDTVITESVIEQVGSKCYANRTSVLSPIGTCYDFMNELGGSFKPQADIHDYTLWEADNQTDLYTTQKSDVCVMIWHDSIVKPSNF